MLRVPMPLPADFEKQLWDAANQLWTNSQLQPSEYSTPVLALIFLKYADHRFSEAKARLEKKVRRRELTKDDFHAEGVLYLADMARYQRLLELPEGADIGKALNDAMKAIEAENPDLKDVLPKTYGRLDAPSLKSLLKTFGTIPKNVEGDVFGRIYEYFLGNFAPATLQKGGEFYTPVSVVRLIVEIIEPFHGRIYDPACGSGGMFVQSARFVTEHQKKPSDEISIFGIERIAATLRLCKMNLAVHGLSGEIKEGNSYYDDPYHAAGMFDFVMANPPFNQPKVEKDRIKDDRARYPFGMPTIDSANYLWIQLFYSALSENGRAGFVMAGPAGDARGSEQELRKRLVETGSVDVVLTFAPNFFYTVALPAAVWFLDKAKARGLRGDKVLFIDAREIYRQLDRAHRDFSPEQIEFLANIVRMYRGKPVARTHGSDKLMAAYFPEGKYVDVANLCQVATKKDIERRGWSLNPGRYVVAAEKDAANVDLAGRLEQVLGEIEIQFRLTSQIEARLAQSVAGVLDVLKNASPGVRGGQLSVLGKRVKLLSGGTPPASDEFWGGDVPWVSCKDMKADRLFDTEDHLTELGAKTGTRMVPPNTTLVVVRGMILAKDFPVAMTMGPMAFNQDLKAVVPLDDVHDGDPLDASYLFYWLKANAQKIRALADEAAHGTKRIQTDRLMSMSIVVPSLSVQRRIALLLSMFDDLVEPRAMLLRRARNILLPQLIFGEIDVSNLVLD